MATVKDTPVSGESPEDQISRAVRLYVTKYHSDATSDESNSNGKPTRKPKKKAPAIFKYLHCWRILSAVPKWQDFRKENNKSQSTEACRQNDAIAAGSSTSINTSTRPDGVKNAKADACAAEVDAATKKRMAAASAAIAKASIKRAKTMEEANNLVLFTVSLESLDADARQFISMRRARVLKQMQEELEEEEKRDDDQEVQAVVTPVVEAQQDETEPPSRDPEIVRDENPNMEAETDIVDNDDSVYNARRYNGSP